MSSMMEPHQQRVVEEKRELDERLAKLNAFIDGAIFAMLPQAEQYRMLKQAAIMQMLSEVLGDRIEHFPRPPTFDVETCGLPGVVFGTTCVRKKGHEGECDDIPF